MSTTVGVHGSVGELFPPAVLRDALDPSGEGDDPAYKRALSDVRVVETADELAGCDALVTFAYDDSFLTSDLSWIHSIQAGVDRFPFEELERRGISLTNSTGIHGDAVGETVAGYMLEFARRLHRHRDREPRREWRYPDWDEAFTLSGESVCVVGLGTLGRGIAARADALGADVVGVRRTPTPVEHVRTVHTPDGIHDAVADARFVAVATPLTDRTRGLVGADELAAMREDAYLLNVSRGGVVDDAALLDALRDGGLAGAALDVFETEPLPEGSPFWDMENVIVTSHAAAANRDYYRRVAALVRENVRRLAAGEPLANRVL
ncbi:D-2-hydroxyacid dehydrogenase [Halorarum salinum]|uniref:D-2-hydroxyacid dehydrogenase n=1 Tax=Halorarum salinum TaxID=2743089 RepID=A0A7D5QCR5_9EURY|nr:D-2-hydroxyacid dehydrogenase [Halobaculum salinum]QLG63558.1 D-2-hydroxyacid dehydrogenase [Halobaculum salinum]